MDSCLAHANFGPLHTTEKKTRQEFPDKKESGKKVKKKEPGKNVMKKRIRQEQKNTRILPKETFPCLNSQDSGYMDLARKSRSVFSGKNHG